MTRVPRKSLSFGKHSRVVCSEPTPVQLAPAFLPLSQVLLTHSGQGELAFFVRYRRDVSAVEKVDCCVVKSTAPHRSARKAFITHAESGPKGTGMGGPKKQFGFGMQVLRGPQSASLKQVPCESVPGAPLAQLK